MSDSATQTILIRLAVDADSDLEELDALTLELRERLLELDVEDVDSVQQETAPAGTKVGGALTVGALAVALGLPAIRQVLDLLKTWVENRPVRTVSVTLGDNTLEVQALSSADQRRLIDAFIASHEFTAPSPALAPQSQTSPSGDTTEEN